MHTVPTDVLLRAEFPVMSPNYSMILWALAAQSVAAFAPSPTRLRGTARGASSPDEGRLQESRSNARCFFWRSVMFASSGLEVLD